jgi:hypothetical protein
MSPCPGLERPCEESQGSIVGLLLIKSDAGRGMEAGRASIAHEYSTMSDPLPSIPRDGGMTCVSASTAYDWGGTRGGTYGGSEEACGRTTMKVIGTWEAAEEKDG